MAKKVARRKQGRCADAPPIPERWDRGTLARELKATAQQVWLAGSTRRDELAQCAAVVVLGVARLLERGGADADAAALRSLRALARDVPEGEARWDFHDLSSGSPAPGQRGQRLVRMIETLLNGKAYRDGDRVVTLTWRGSKRSVAVSAHLVFSAQVSRAVGSVLQIGVRWNGAASGPSERTDSQPFADPGAKAVADALVEAGLATAEGSVTAKPGEARAVLQVAMAALKVPHREREAIAATFRQRKKRQATVRAT